MSNTNPCNHTWGEDSCTKCGKSRFYSPTNLTNTVCPVCGLDFSDKPYLLSHHMERPDHYPPIVANSLTPPNSQEEQPHEQ